MTRRCSVMRMPLDAHCSSIEIWSTPTSISAQGPGENTRLSARAVRPRIIGRAGADLGKAEAGVKAERGNIFFIDFENDAAGAGRLKAGEVARQERRTSALSATPR